MARCEASVLSDHDNLWVLTEKYFLNPIIVKSISHSGVVKESKVLFEKVIFSYMMSLVGNVVCVV